MCVNAGEMFQEKRPLVLKTQIDEIGSKFRQEFFIRHEVIYWKNAKQFLYTQHNQ